MRDSRKFNLNKSDKIELNLKWEIEFGARAGSGELLPIRLIRISFRNSFDFGKTEDKNNGERIAMAVHMFHFTCHIGAVVNRPSIPHFSKLPCWHTLQALLHARRAYIDCTHSLLSHSLTSPVYFYFFYYISPAVHVRSTLTPISTWEMQNSKHQVIPLPQIPTWMWWMKQVYAENCVGRKFGCCAGLICIPLDISMHILTRSHSFLI